MGDVEPATLEPGSPVYQSTVRRSISVVLVIEPTSWRSRLRQAVGARMTLDGEN
jgi:hypothetical protein